MPDITCPDCGRMSELVAIRRAADEFCTHCDFPLFWAPSSIPVTTPGGNSAAALRRLPGAGGRQRIGSKICPECGELNAMGEIHCGRCGSELDPRPVEPEVVVVLPPPRPVAIPAPAPWWWIWRWWLLAGGLAAIGIAAVVVYFLNN